MLNFESLVIFSHSYPEMCSKQFKNDFNFDKKEQKSILFLFTLKYEHTQED